MTSPARPERHALLELDGLLAEIAQLAAEGDRARFDSDDRYRWLLHRLWIAVGNEAFELLRLGVADQNIWVAVYQFRNRLAHRRLPDIDEDEVWRMTLLRVNALRQQVRDALR